eukprot:5650166-Lingulodinium_polyedra.AAC.1
MQGPSLSRLRPLAGTSTGVCNYTLPVPLITCSSSGAVVGPSQPVLLGQPLILALFALLKLFSTLSDS